jgi:hypothetical protein
MIITPTEHDAPYESTDPGELLIKEARQKARRRRLMVGVGLLVVVLVIASLIIALSGGSAKHGPSRSLRSNALGATSQGLPVGPYASLDLAGPLAVGPNGRLYVVDVARDRILVRLSNGRFRVVAGDGRVGFSGDGGPAHKAGLSKVSQIAFGPQGSLYIADGARVRVINARGVIRTVAGDGEGGRAHLITSGTPALSASLGSQLSIAISVKGQLYISTVRQLLRLTPSGLLDPLSVRVGSGPLKTHPDAISLVEIAVSEHGIIDVSGVNGWSIWQRSASGVATYVGYARGSGGNFPVLARGPDGAVYGETGSGIVRVERKRLVTTFVFNKVHGEYFYLSNFAFGPHGSLYADDLSGDTGFEAHQQLVSVSGTRVRLLWQESNVVSR